MFTLFHIEELFEWASKYNSSIIGNKTSARQCNLIPKTLVLNFLGVVPYSQRKGWMYLTVQQTFIPVFV
jgi:hypothetical protein